jgi:DNA repair exonuclease SbcCD nuclease subunit
VDAQDAYRRAVDEMLARGVDVVIHSGDVFDNVRPATHVIMGFLKQTFRLVEAGIPVYVAAGNHETPRLRTTSAALEYAGLIGIGSAHGFEVESRLERVKDTNVAITLVPHGAIESSGAVLPDPGADVNILVTHGMVPNMENVSREMGEANLHSGLLDARFDYIALGHYHGFHPHRENAYYAGATERFSFNEVEFEPGFAIVEFGEGSVPSVEHVPVQTRKMLDLGRIEAGGMEAMGLTEEIERRSRNAGIDEAIVRLRAVNVARGVTGEIDRELLRELRGRCLNFSLEIGHEEGPEGGLEGDATAFGPLAEEFEAFVASRELEEKFAAEFLERGREYLRRASEEMG